MVTHAMHIDVERQSKFPLDSIRFRQVCVVDQLDNQSDFFAQLPSNSVIRGLAGLDMTTRRKPFPKLRMTDQEGLSFVYDDASNNKLYLRFAQPPPQPAETKLSVLHRQRKHGARPFFALSYPLTSYHR